MRDQFRLADPDFDVFQDGVKSYSITKKTELAISVSNITNITSKSADWSAFFAISKNKKTASQVDNENTRAMKSKYIQFLRPFVKQCFYDNPLATNADILAAGLQTHSESRERSAIVSDEVPSVTAEPKAGHVMLFHCLNAAGKVAKPAKMVFLRVKWFAGADAPTDPTLFTCFKDFSAHPVQITFNAADAGKPLAFAVCYVTKKGPEAPFTTIVHTMVP